MEDAKIELEKHKPVQGTYLNLLKGFQTCFYKTDLSLNSTNKRSFESTNAFSSQKLSSNDNKMFDINDNNHGFVRKDASF